MKKRLIKNLASKYFYEKTSNREACYAAGKRSTYTTGNKGSFSQTQKKREKLLDEAEKRTKLNKKSAH